MLLRILYIAAYPAPLRQSTRSVTNNFVVGTLNRCTQNPVGCKSKSGGGGEKKRRTTTGAEKALERELILYSTYIYVFIWTTPRVWYMVWWEESRVPIGNSRIHVRTQNKGLCIVTHIFNLENGRLRNNPSFFLHLPLQGQNGRFSFPRIFYSSSRTIYLTPVFLTSDALWNRNVPFSFFTSDTRL